jgi:hypothetical protein
MTVAMAPMNSTVDPRDAEEMSSPAMMGVASPPRKDVTEDSNAGTILMNRTVHPLQARLWEPLVNAHPQNSLALIRDALMVPCNVMGFQIALMVLMKQTVQI